MQYIAYAQRGDLRKCAEESFDCVSCGCCSVSRCPAGISHPMVGLLARRLTGKYIAPEAKHLTKRVEEIHEGKVRRTDRADHAKPITEMEELYNTEKLRNKEGQVMYAPPEYDGIHQKGGGYQSVPAYGNRAATYDRGGEGQLLREFHPDYRAEAFEEIKVGPTKVRRCRRSWLICCIPTAVF